MHKKGLLERSLSGLFCMTGLYDWCVGPASGARVGGVKCQVNTLEPVTVFTTDCNAYNFILLLRQFTVQ